ncbi:MAG: DUF1064 domain-containing protein [Methylococcaceae bacterium]
MKPSKYGNKKCLINGITFDSKREGHHYLELLAMERAGIISNLELQKVFHLAESCIINGRKKPPLRYIADFCYVQDGKQVVADSKGMLTDVYKIKRHLMATVHHIAIVEIK